MEILLLGVGMQGKAALQDLIAHSSYHITAADKDFDSLKTYVATMDYGERVDCCSLDANDSEEFDSS